MQETHRPGLLKQKNKTHKHGRHRSKSQIDAASKGKVSIKLASKNIRQDPNKKDRRNQSSQMRLQHREQLMMNKRLFGGANAPPYLVTVVPLGDNLIPEKFTDFIFTADLEAKVSCTPNNVFHVRLPLMKQRFSFILPDRESVNPTLDALKVSDAVVFLLSAKNSKLVSSDAELLLSILTAQGIPSPSVVLMDTEDIPNAKRFSVRTEAQKAMSRWLPGVKVMKVERSDDALTLLRRLANQKPKILLHRSTRPYLLVENLACASENPEADHLTVKLSGYLRGQPLSVNSLVHIPGWGDFQMAQIDAPPDPHASEPEGGATQTLQVANPEKQASLVTEIIPDPMDAEQTWPTAEEFKEAAESRRKLKKVPKGTSDYQACWIPDDISDNDDENSEEEEEEDDDRMDVISEAGSWQENEESEIVETVTKSDNYDAEIDREEETKTYEQLRAAREEVAFPDEMDTPTTVPARERFAKYRGLASFRTSPWDPKESLPQDYARIFQFENFERTRKRILQRCEELLDSVTPGRYITIHVKNVPKELVTKLAPTEPLVLFGLLPHENKMSVINFVVKRFASSARSNIPIKSKEPVVIHCGYRRYRCRPIYSQHTNGSKHKYERYFQPDSIAVATTYAPIMYPPASVLMFSENGQSLLATGRVLSIDPDRLIIKRVVLSGHPFRVLKHSAIIRFMFFNREDIEWFKPVELHTKYGRRGHIKEPLGTHGHMKAVFDDQLKSQDTVLMSLFRRVFPPWSYDIHQQPKSSMLIKKLSLIPDENMDK